MSKSEQAKRLLRALDNVDDIYIVEAADAALPTGSASRGKLIPFPRLIKCVAIAAACLVVFIIGKSVISGKPAPQATEGNNVDVSNPYDEVGSISEAEAITGFGMNVPQPEEPYTKMTVTVVDGNMISVSFCTDDETVTGYEIRKAVGSEDISGDYSEYANVQTQTIGEYEVTLKGAGNTWSVATWNYGGYAYSVDAQDKPMALDALTGIISAVK